MHTFRVKDIRWRRRCAFASRSNRLLYRCIVLFAASFSSSILNLAHGLRQIQKVMSKHYHTFLFTVLVVPTQRRILLLNKSLRGVR